MESLVLCPEELCLGPAAARVPVGVDTSAEFSIWTNEAAEKGARFLPWKGTVRSDKLAVYNKLPEFDIRNRFGLYDQVTEVPSPLPGVTLRLRQCNWIRFLRYSLVYSDAVNVVGTKSPSSGEPVFELIKDVDAKTELICFFVPERPEEAAFLLPAIQYLRQTLFKKLVDNVLEDSPLDLSPKHVFPVSPTHSEGRKSVSSDCTTSTNESANSVGVNSVNAIATSIAASIASNASKNFTIPKPPFSIEALTAKSPVKSYSLSEIRKSPIPNPPSPLPMPNSNSPLKLSLPNFPPGPKKSTSQPLRTRKKPMLPCSYCGKCFDRPSLLKRHIRIHTGERPHVCDVCSKGFSTSSSLNTHRRIHSGEKPHQCGVCGKRFTASSNLYYHKMTHVKEKPHKCTMCSKSFPTPGDLKSHTYVHTGTWPFKCHICHRGFSKQTNLKNHLLLHSGDKPFSCDICQKKFALSCNLRAHLKTHEAEFQSSQASLALYQRALAVLGQQAQAAQSGPSSPEEGPEEGPEESESRGESPEGPEESRGSQMEERENSNSNIMEKTDEATTSPPSSPPIELPKLTVAV